LSLLSERKITILLFSGDTSLYQPEPRTEEILVQVDEQGPVAVSGEVPITISGDSGESPQVHTGTESTAADAPDLARELDLPAAETSSIDFAE
jgi:hypothetical protein